MTYEVFLNRIIDDGIEAAKRDYKASPHKRQGAVAGFEACRGKSPSQLTALMQRVRSVVARAAKQRTVPKRYWRLRCFEAEIGWTCNVLSSQLTTPIAAVTARGVMKAAGILGAVPPRN